MKAVHLAGGTGGRLQHHTDDKAKVMVEVGGKPMIEYTLEYLSDADIDEIVVITGYRHSDITSYYGSEFDGMPIEYSRQTEQKGTAHALLKAEEYIEEDFLLMYPDNIFGQQFILNKIIKDHLASSADGSLLYAEASIERAEESGVINLNSNGNVESVVEKPDSPDSRRVLTGVYVFSPVIFDASRVITPGSWDEYQLTDAIDVLIYAGRQIEAVECEVWSVNVNTPSDIKKAENKLS